MADRVDYFFREKVTADELNLGFELLEEADEKRATDMGVVGIVTGMAVTQHAPVANLTLDLTAPGIAYDPSGQRIFFATPQTADLSVDENGVSTAVSAAGKEKVVSLYAKFDRALSDPRIDGNSLEVFFRRDESFKLVVDQGAEAPAGTATPPGLRPDAILLCDATRRFGQTQLLAADLSFARRQNYVLGLASPLAVDADFVHFHPAARRAQAPFEAIDSELGAHYAGADGRHAAQDVDAAPLTGAPNHHPAGTVQAGLQAVEDDLNAQVANLAAPAGAGLVGSAALTGAAKSHAAGTVAQALQGLEDDVNAVVADLASQAAGKGTALVGHQGSAGAPDSIPASTLLTALDALLKLLNERAKLSGAIFSGPVLFKVGAKAPAGKAIEAGVVRADAGVGGAMGFRFGATADGLEWDPALGGVAVVKAGVPAPLMAGLVEIPMGPGTILAQHLNSGAANPNTRFYQDTADLLIAINAYWNGAAWQAAVTGDYSALLRFSRFALSVSQKNPTTGTWTNWDKTATLDLPSGEWIANGPEAGMFGIGSGNNGAVPYADVAINFKRSFAATPSSVTHTKIDDFNIDEATYPAIYNLRSQGCSVYAWGKAAGHFYWNGTYQANP